MLKRVVYLPQLDTIKLIAMLLVFSTHCYFLKDYSSTEGLYNKYFVYSGIGVEFFIMISGFFSAYTFKQISIKDYMVKKSYRLFPVHWTCLIIGGYLLGIRCGKIPYLTPLSVPLLQSLVPISGDTNPPCWTISTLFILYFITPTLINKLSKLQHKSLLPIVFVLCVVSTTINMLFYDPTRKLLFYFLYVSPYFRIVTYTIGLLIGLHASKVDKQKNNSVATASLLELIPLLLILGIILFFHKSPGYWYTFPLSLLILFFAKGEGVFSKILSMNFFQKISKISFCFYLIHFPILEAVRYYLQQYDVSNRSVLLLVLMLSLIISLIAALLLHVYIEIPLGKVKRSSPEN